METLAKLIMGNSLCNSFRITMGRLVPLLLLTTTANLYLYYYLPLLLLHDMLLALREQSPHPPFASQSFPSPQLPRIPLYLGSGKGAGILGPRAAECGCSRRPGVKAKVPQRIRIRFKSEVKYVSESSMSVDKLTLITRC